MVAYGIRCVQTDKLRILKTRGARNFSRRDRTHSQQRRSTPLENQKNCCCKKTTARSEEERRALISRLNRIEGQVRGLRGMIEQDAYCVDILTQSASIGGALAGFNKELLARHIRTCVERDLRAGDEGVVEELISLLGKMLE